jgi:hypothetical protein
MRQSLIRHPDFPCAAVTAIDIEIERPPNSLTLRYIVSGRIADLRTPRMAFPKRTDELWHHTCFEAFICPVPGTAYLEFNLAPSTQWAAYRFSGYRAGMADVKEFTLSQIDVQSDASSYELQVSLDLTPIADFPIDAVWRLALSTVIEETSGAISFWALRHPPGKPDFHHSDCFALELPAP